MSERHICVIGDVHGHLQLALLVAARWQQELDIAFDAVLLAGDVGTFATHDAMDKATRRHAEENPCEIEFAAQWMAEEGGRHLTRIFEPAEKNGCGLTAPVLMVTGNHEGFTHLEEVHKPTIPPAPVPASDLPRVDRHGRIALLPSGWRTVTTSGVAIGGLGGIQRDQRKSEYHELAYITDDQLVAITEGDEVDVLVTHTGPEITQPWPKGSDVMNVVADARIARVWCHGHSIENDEIRDHHGTTIVPLHGVAFGRRYGPRDGEPGENAWCHITLTDGDVSVDRCRPWFWRDYHRRNWTERADGQLVAPQLG